MVVDIEQEALEVQNLKLSSLLKLCRMKKKKKACGYAFGGGVVNDLRGQWGSTCLTMRHMSPSLPELQVADVYFPVRGL